jgi:protein-L-isoaspartate(D-aspartate) O-methyltransferase
MTTKQALINFWRKKGLDEKLLKAFREVDRKKFMLQEFKASAYIDKPFPIVGGQTISQPFTVMFMLALLDLKKTDKVLEIGAGSGYNAALIAKLAKKIYAIEYNKEVFKYAKENTKKIKNIEIILGDGSLGYEKAAPYDKIIVTAATPKLLPAWKDQLKEGGIIVAPVGKPGYCDMVRAKKIKGRLEEQFREKGFTFVPLLGKKGYNKKFK